ncbi:hypothetical protein ACWF8F_36340, partial [Streptomyces sp. NPDC055055]
QFEETFKGQIEEQVNNGTLQVRYHMLPMLNQRSDPPGYSLDSANASLAAADAGKFLAFHVVDDPRALHEPYLVRNREILDALRAGERGTAERLLARYLDDSRTRVTDAYARAVDAPAGPAA